jgi:hypothetical protein
MRVWVCVRVCECVSRCVREGVLVAVRGCVYVRVSKGVGVSVRVSVWCLCVRNEAQTRTIKLLNSPGVAPLGSPRQPFLILLIRESSLLESNDFHGKVERKLCGTPISAYSNRPYYFVLHFDTLGQHCLLYRYYTLTPSHRTVRWKGQGIHGNEGIRVTGGRGTVYTGMRVYVGQVAGIRYKRE